MSARGTRLLFLGLVAVSCLAVFGPPALAQCSMCQQVVSQSPEARRIGAELNRAILLMFVAPYLIFTSFALVIFRAPVGRQVRRVVRAFFLPR
jgi:hypothetical protein